MSTECSPDAAVEATVSQLAGTDLDSRPAVVVGGMCSKCSSAVAHLLRAFQMPLLSFRSNAAAQSDPDIFPYFLRSVPSAEMQGEAIVALASHLGVTRMGALYGNGEYSDIAHGSQHFAPERVIIPSSSFEGIVSQKEEKIGGKAHANVDLTLMCKLEALHRNSDGMRHFLFSLGSVDTHYAATAMYHSGFLRGEDFMYYSVDSWSLAMMEGFESSDLCLWWYNSDNLSGFWKVVGSSSWMDDKDPVQVPAAVVPLVQHGSTLKSISLDGDCHAVSGVVNIGTSGQAGGIQEVELRGRRGSAILEGGERRIVWSDGEVWAQLSPPKLTDLQDLMKGSLGLVADSSGPKMEDYINSVWKTKPDRYTFDDNNVFSDDLQSADLGWFDSDGDRNEILNCGPAAYDAAIAVSFALDAVIKEGGDVNNGELLKDKILATDFEGLSGRVGFRENGDRSRGIYAVWNQNGAGRSPSMVGVLEMGGKESINLSQSLTYRGSMSAFPGDGGCSTNLGGEACSGRGICVYGSIGGVTRSLLAGYHPSTGSVRCTCFDGFKGDRCQDEEPKPIDVSLVLGITLPLATLLLALLGFFIHRRYFSYLARAHVFISYKHKDQEAAALVKAELESKGNMVWIDSQITPGEDWKGEIASAICDSVCVVFLASKEAVLSRYCREEILFASSINKPVVTLLLEDCVRDMKGGMRMVLMRKQFLDVRGPRLKNGMHTCCKLIRQMRMGRQSHTLVQNFGRKTAAPVIFSPGSSPWRKKASSIFFPNAVTPEEIEEQVSSSEVLLVSSQKDSDVAKNILSRLTETGVDAFMTNRVNSEVEEGKDTSDYATNAARIKKTKLILFLETAYSMDCSDCNDEIFFAYENQVPILRAHLGEYAIVTHFSGSMAMMLNISPVIAVQHKAAQTDKGSGQIVRRVLHELFLQEHNMNTADAAPDSRRASRRKSSLASGGRSGGSMANLGALFSGRQGSVTIQTMLAKRTSSAFNLRDVQSGAFGKNPHDAPAEAVEALRNNSMPTGDIV